MASGRKPDYYLSAKNMDTSVKGRCGAAWKNDDGSISIVLDPWVTLQSPGYSWSKIAIALYPNDGEEGFAKRRVGKQLEPAPASGGDLDDDDIPF